MSFQTPNERNFVFLTILDKSQEEVEVQRQDVHVSDDHN